VFPRHAPEMKRSSPAEEKSRFQEMESCGKLKRASPSETAKIPGARKKIIEMTGGRIMEDRNKSADSNRMLSSTGLEANVAGLLCYLIPLLSGLLFLILEKNSRFVKFHAMQAVLAFGVLFAAYYVSGIIPFIGALIRLLTQLLGFILWILLMVKAYGKEWFRLPVIGEMAEKHIQ